MKKKIRKSRSFPGETVSKKMLFKAGRNQNYLKSNPKGGMFIESKTQKELFRPFIYSFSGHQDSILKVKTHPQRSSLIFSGSSDGEIKFWLLNERKCLKTLKAHEKFIRGLEIDNKGDFVISCSDDGFLKLWEISEFGNSPKISFKALKSFNSLSAHPTELVFATGGEEILIWDQVFFKPIQKLSRGMSSVSSIKFNPIEHNVIISSGSDRSILLYDLRLHLPVKKFLMEMRSNDICWNRTVSSEFTLANEDSNLYTFDLRNLSQVKKVHQGHVLPVISIAQDLENQDLLSGSLDSTIRVSPQSSLKIPEIFFTQRMYRVLSVCFSIDRMHVLSGSEDGNIRLWKRTFDYLKNENWKGVAGQTYSTVINGKPVNPENASYNHPFFPKMVKKIRKLRYTISQKKKKKEEKINRHIGPGFFLFRPKFKRPVIEEVF